MSEKVRQQQPIFPGPCPIDPELGIPICPPPSEIDIIKVKKVFNECMNTQVEEIKIPVPKSIAKNSTQAEEVECSSVTASNINCQDLGNDVVRVTFDLEVCSNIPLDFGGFAEVCETKVISKTFRVDRASEENLNVQCHVFPQCLFCFISERGEIDCIFDNFIEKAYKTLPNNEIKEQYKNLYYKYRPLLTRIINRDLSLKAYKLLNKYTPALQYSIDDNFGHDIQIDKDDIEKITSLIQDFVKEIEKTGSNNNPSTKQLINFFNNFADHFHTFEGQNLASILQNAISVYKNKNENENLAGSSNNFSIPIGVIELTCCVGVLILIKVDSEVQLLVPTYGYPAPPPECGEFLGECPTDYTPQWPPYPPQTGFGGGGTTGCKGC